MQRLCLHLRNAVSGRYQFWVVIFLHTFPVAFDFSSLKEILMSGNHYLQYNTFNPTSLNQVFFQHVVLMLIFFFFFFLKLNFFKRQAGAHDFKAFTPKIPSPFELSWQIQALIQSIDCVLRPSSALRQKQWIQWELYAWSKGYRMTHWVLFKLG